MSRSTRAISSTLAAEPRILIADDQTDVLEALRLLLKRDGYKVEAVESPKEALQAIENRDYDLALIDLNYSRDTTSAPSESGSSSSRAS